MWNPAGTQMKFIMEKRSHDYNLGGLGGLVPFDIGVALAPSLKILVHCLHPWGADDGNEEELEEKEGKMASSEHAACARHWIKSITGFFIFLSDGL